MHATMPRLGKVQADLETSTRTGEFCQLARLLIRAKGNLLQATRFPGINPRVRDLFEKAATTPGAMSNWGSALVEYQSIATAFLESLRHFGAFDAMLPSMRRIPMRTRVVMVTLGATGTTVPEASVKPITSLTVDGGTTSEKKSGAIVVISDELARLADEATTSLFGRELKNAVALETDTQALAIITSGLSPITSSGVTSTAVLDDLSAALDAVETTAASKLFVVTTSTIAKRWSTMATADGAVAFAGMTPMGGTVAGMPCIVTDGLSAGQFLVVDAYSIAAAAGGIELDASSQASVEMSDSPTSPPSAATILHSLWQHGNTGLKAERFFVVEPLHSAAAALVQSAVYSPQ